MTEFKELTMPYSKKKKKKKKVLKNFGKGNTAKSINEGRMLFVKAIQHL